MESAKLGTVVKVDEVILYDFSMLTKVVIDNTSLKTVVTFDTTLYDNYMASKEEKWESVEITIQYNENPEVFCSLLNVYNGYERLKKLEPDKYNVNNMNVIERNRFPKFRNDSVKHPELAFPTSNTYSKVPASFGIAIINERTIVLTFYKEPYNPEKREIVLQKGIYPDLDIVISIFQDGFNQLQQTVPYNNFKECEQLLQSAANSKMKESGNQYNRTYSKKQ